MGLFSSRRPVTGDVAPVPLVEPRSTVDGWTLAGTVLAGRVRREDQRELATLLHGVSIRVDTAYTYERASQMLERVDELEQALTVCEEWLAHPASQRPVAASTTRLMTKRRARLRARVAEQRASAEQQPLRGRLGEAS